MAGGGRAAVPLPILALEQERQSEADAGVAKPPSLHCPRPRAGLASLQKKSFLKFGFFVAVLLLVGAVRGRRAPTSRSDPGRAPPAPSPPTG